MLEAGGGGGNGPGGRSGVDTLHDNGESRQGTLQQRSESKKREAGGEPGEAGVASGGSSGEGLLGKAPKGGTAGGDGDNPGSKECSKDGKALVGGGPRGNGLPPLSNEDPSR